MSSGIAMCNAMGACVARMLTSSLRAPSSVCTAPYGMVLMSPLMSAVLLMYSTCMQMRGLCSWLLTRHHRTLQCMLPLQVP